MNKFTNFTTYVLFQPLLLLVLGSFTVHAINGVDDILFGYKKLAMYNKTGWFLKKDNKTSSVDRGGKLTTRKNWLRQAF